jgi:branched-chain amino acid transport system substrate-binding protein
MSIQSGKFICFVTAVAVATAGLFFIYHLNSEDKEPIKIGLVTTLTGPASTAGICTRNGALLAIEQANSRGGVKGRRVEALIRDDKADPAEALRIDQELIDQGVVAFLGHYLSSVTVNVVPLMNANNMLMLSLGAATGELYALDDSFVRIMYANNIRAALAAQVTRRQLGAEKVSVVYDLSNAAYTRSAFELFRDELERLGGQVVLAVTYASRETFSAPEIAAELMASKAEGIYIISDAMRAALICQHLKKQGAAMPLMVSAWASVVPEFIGYGGQAVEGVYSVVESDASSTRPEYLAFVKAYQDRFGQVPILHGQSAYDAARILLKTLEKTTDSQALKQAVLDQGVFMGVNGKIRIDSTGEPTRPVYLMQIRDGQMQVIETLNANLMDS